MRAHAVDRQVRAFFEQHFTNASLSCLSQVTKKIHIIRSTYVDGPA